MNWYKKAQSQNYPVWLAEQIKILTDNYTKPLGHYEHYIPEIEKWIKETNPDLTNLSFNDAYIRSTGHRYNKVPEGSLEQIKRNMNKFYSESQNISPNAPNFAVDPRLKSKSIPSGTKRKINKYIHDLGNYHTEIPLKTIFNICEQNDVIPLQEDGTYWSGMLIGGEECGSEKANTQVANFNLAIKIENAYVPANNILRITWCKMSSGKYEIVCYVS